MPINPKKLSWRRIHDSFAEVVTRKLAVVHRDKKVCRLLKQKVISLHWHIICTLPLNNQIRYLLPDVLSRQTLGGLLEQGGWTR